MATSRCHLLLEGRRGHVGVGRHGPLQGCDDLLELHLLRLDLLVELGEALLLGAGDPLGDQQAVGIDVGLGHLLGPLGRG